jgi:ankyrin repeat protein
LIAAARSGDTAQIKQLAAAGADLNAPGGVNNWTPMMHAIHKNQARAVEALLAAGADPNIVSGRTTALIMAAGYGQADIVQILLNHGAIPGPAALAAAVGGTTDFDDYTAGKCQTDAVKALLAKDPGLTLSGDSEAVQTAQRGGCTEVLALVSAPN